jgi:hypothetical protein
MPGLEPEYPQPAWMSRAGAMETGETAQPALECGDGFRDAVARRLAERGAASAVLFPAMFPLKKSRLPLDIIDNMSLTGGQWSVVV